MNPLDSTVPFDDPDPRRALDRGRARGESIRAEIEDRRPRIRRAASLAKILAHSMGAEMLPKPRLVPYPSTIAGIATARARRIQLRETSLL